MEAGDSVNPWIRNLKPYVPGQTREGFVKLASNENNYGPSPKVIAALRDSAGSVYRYPYKDDVVREKIAGYTGLGKENVILGNGSDELIDLLVKTFKGPSCGVYPSFSEYRIVSATNGMDYVEVPLAEDFSFPLTKFKAQTRESNLIFLCTPNNPPGNTISLDTIKEILDLGKVTVIDEAYYEFYGKTALDLLQEYDNLIILRTFAKAFGLAGLRAGYGLASPGLIDLIYKTKPPFNVNYLAQEAMLAALDDIAYMQGRVDDIKKDRKILLAKLSAKFKAFPSQANFVLADTSPKSAQEVFDFFLSKKMIIRKFGEFPGFPGQYVRVTVGTNRENQDFYAALDELE
ncbi:MAG: histidinol-phosphate transaminase [Candidatus Altiarchaeota archaeon]